MNTLFNMNDFFVLTLIHIFIGLVCGSLVSLSYVLSDTKRNSSSNFAIATVILPSVVSVVIGLVGSDLAKAVSLGGIFALVRFRSIAGNSRDILYVFFSMAVGLAVGMSAYLIAISLAVIIGFAFIILSKYNFAKCKGESKVLKITVSEDMNFATAFNEVFEKFLNKWSVTNVKTTNMGTLFTVTYSVVPNKSFEIKAFMDEVRIRNGNLNIIYGNPEDMSQDVL